MIRVNKVALVPTTNHNQSLTLNLLTCDGVESKAETDSNTTDAVIVKRAYSVVDRRALKFAQFFAAMQESQWSWENAVHYLKLAYGFPSTAPAPLMQFGGGESCITKSLFRLSLTSLGEYYSMLKTGSSKHTNRFCRVTT